MVLAGRTLFAAVAASLALLCGGAATAAAEESIRLRIVNDTEMALNMPAESNQPDGCVWRGTAGLLSAGETGEYTIAAAAGRSGMAPCTLSITAPILGSPRHASARMTLYLGVPADGQLMAGIRYAYLYPDEKPPWIELNVLLTELQPGSDGVYRLDLTELDRWIRRTTD